jgi:hypothetical protein
MQFTHAQGVGGGGSGRVGAAYPVSALHRAGNFTTLFDTTLLPYGRMYDNCSNTLCYTQSKGTLIYKPHTAYGMVGRSAAGYLAQRRRL